MQKTKSNKNISIIRDPEKSYVYIKDGSEEIGMLLWHYERKRWIFMAAISRKKR